MNQIEFAKPGRGRPFARGRSGKSRRPAGRGAQPQDLGRGDPARWRSRGLDPQSGRIGARWRPVDLQPTGLACGRRFGSAANAPCRRVAHARLHALPRIESAADIAAAMTAIAAALGDGIITSGEGKPLPGSSTPLCRVIEANDFARHVTAIERAEAAADETIATGTFRRYSTCARI